MIYLIGQLSGWLLLAAAFAALAGWAFAAQRAAPAEHALRRDRSNLLRDLSRLAAGEHDGASAADLNGDPIQSRADVRESRIAELERAVEQARARADSASADLAAMQRRGGMSDADAADLARLRAAENERAREIAVVAEPVAEPVAAAAVVDDDTALQGWRLRYFEQRVRYLETLTRPAAAPTPLAAPVEAPPVHEALALEWRARDAEARAAYLTQELRAPAAAEPEPAPSEEAAPFAANADVDVLLRWRLLYLERRVAHLQEAASAVQPVLAPAPAAGVAPDLDRWKWRARYLESRVRHLETHRVEIATLAAPIEAEAAEESAPASTGPRGVKPPTLPSARNGGPDDFTLIDDISAMQQSTFYSLGIFHFDQIAAWTPENVAWVDHYLRLRGRIDDEEWLEQAGDLAREGVSAARRIVDEEDA